MLLLLLCVAVVGVNETENMRQELEALGGGERRK